MNCHPIKLTSDKRGRLLVQLTPTTSVAAALITVGEFADFIRREAYFDPRYWPRSFELPPGGDAPLRRIQYSWSNRSKPALNLTWYEANAYALEAGGRLPWYAETLVFGCGDLNRKALKKLDLERRVAGYYTSHGACSWSATGTLVEKTIGEWCADLYHPTVHGPDLVRPEPPLRRRVFNALRPAMTPDTYSPTIGFRILYETSGAQGLHHE